MGRLEGISVHVAEKYDWSHKTGDLNSTCSFINLSESEDVCKTLPTISFQCKNVRKFMYSLHVLSSCTVHYQHGFENKEKFCTSDKAEMQYLDASARSSRADFSR